MSTAATESVTPAPQSTRDIRRLYAYHLLNGLALSFIGSELFTTNLFQRLELSKTQIGLIFGVGMWVPALINMLAAPLILQRRWNRHVVALFGLGRWMLAALFLVLPLCTRAPGILTACFVPLMVAFMTLPFIAGNSLGALIRTHVPTATLGRHSAVMLWLWDCPARFSVILCAWLLDRHTGAGHAFLTAMWIALLATGLLYVPAGVAIWSLTPEPPQEAPRIQLRQLFAPFAIAKFRTVGVAIFAVNVLLAMVGTFFFLSLREGQEWSLLRYSLVGAALSVGGAVITPLWGRLADRIGGRNVFYLALMGTGASLFLLCSVQPWAIWLFAALAWAAGMGIFGSGITVGQRYLMLTVSHPQRSNIDLAAMTLVVSTGYAVGSLSGGMLLDWSKTLMPSADEPAHYRLYFATCGMLFLLTAQIIRLLKDEAPHFTVAEMVTEVYLEIRGLANKWR